MQNGATNKHMLERLGAGLLHVTHAVVTSRVVLDLEQWYLLFGLMSTASASWEGRQFVFRAVSALIESNCVNNHNFTPCRHLLVRFVSNSFSNLEEREGGDGNGGGDGVGIQGGREPSRAANPWEALAQVRLLYCLKIHFNPSGNLPLLPELYAKMSISSHFVFPLSPPPRIVSSTFAGSCFLSHFPRE